VMAKVVPAVKPEDDLLTTGVQLLNTGDLKAALARLAGAHARDPLRPDIAVAYSQALFRSGDYRRVASVLQPLGAGEEPVAEVLALLGQAHHALGEFGEAVRHYSNYLVRFGANVDILNWLGTCHYQLGNKDEALKAWTKSLEIGPGQEKIKALVESIKKK